MCHLEVITFPCHQSLTFMFVNWHRNQDDQHHSVEKKLFLKILFLFYHEVTQMAWFHLNNNFLWLDSSRMIRTWRSNLFLKYGRKLHQNYESRRFNMIMIDSYNSWLVFIHTVLENTPENAIENLIVWKQRLMKFAILCK